MANSNPLDSNNCLESLIELYKPLRVGNLLKGSKLYKWFFLVPLKGEIYFNKVVRYK